MNLNDKLLTVLMWFIFLGGLASLLGIPFRSRRAHFVRLGGLVFLTACYGFYEWRMPASYDIRLDLLFVLLPLVAAWIALLISFALPRRKQPQ